MQDVKQEHHQKVNYDQELRNDIATWQVAKHRLTILLHSCCAPCSTYSLEFLCEYANVTVYFANANIHPSSEYHRRARVQKDFIHAFNLRTGNQVGFIEAAYRPNDFIKRVKHLSDEPEGGLRCQVCFQMRLDLVAKKAAELNFDYFGSALTLSPKKPANIINEIGLDIQKIYQVAYLPSDFKKKNGYQRSLTMCKEYDIYRQCYCGCVFAAKQQGVDLKKINQEAQSFLDAQADSSSDSE